jgi:hypothetical protein
VAFIGDENADCAPAFLRAERSAHVFKQRRFKQEAPLQDRVVEWAKDIRKQADVMRPSPERDQLLKKLRQAETAMHMEDWARPTHNHGVENVERKATAEAPAAAAGRGEHE